MGLQERVSQWIIYQKKMGISQTTIAKSWGVSVQYISSFKTKKGETEENREKGKVSIGLNVIQRILDFDKKLNARWLILGEGEMYSTSDDKSIDVILETAFSLKDSEVEQFKEDMPEYTPTLFKLFESNKVLFKAVVELKSDVRELLSKEKSTPKASKSK